jgi:7-cyano-7-deazaguanine reductase
MITIEDVLINSPLGKTTQYEDIYAPHLLCSIPREAKRNELGIPEKLPFKGIDIWNACDGISWLNNKGKPCVALGEFIVPCTSRYLFESKSFKLYLLSFSQTRYESLDEVQRTLASDLHKATGEIVQVKLVPIHESHGLTTERLEGTSLDDQDLEFNTYHVNPEFLGVETEEVSETLCSDLLKSNCLVTGQPDWGSIQIRYTGKKIDRAGLLKYIVSFRSHNGFAEHCVERIFTDLMRYCTPEKLAVYACYTSRGGLAIKPYRSTEDDLPKNVQLCRQ